MDKVVNNAVNQSSSNLQVGDLAIITVSDDHRLASYNGRIVRIWSEQPDLPLVTERYVIKSEFDAAHNRYEAISFVNTCNLQDLIPYEIGVRESMMALMTVVAERQILGEIEKESKG